MVLESFVNNLEKEKNNLSFLESETFCDYCPLDKAVNKKELIRASERNEFKIFYNDGADKNNLDLLVLTDSVEIQEDFTKLKNYLKRLGITNFAIAPAIGCRTFNFELPAPMYSTYSSCKCLDVKKIKPRAVLAMGKSLFHFTKSSAYDSWREFNEIVFNETWFLPAFDYDYKVRIYPTAFIHDILKFDSFENFHFKHQVASIKNYLKDYQPVIVPKYRKEIVTDFRKFIEENKNKKYVAIDTETNSLNVFIDNFKVGCITMSFDGITGYYIPINIIEKDLFEDFIENKFLIASNGKYDSKGLKRVGIKNMKVSEDTTLVFHLLNTERDSNSLKVLAWLIGFGGYDKKLSEYIKKNKLKSYLDVPENLLSDYAILDAVVTFRLWQFAKKYLIPKQMDTYQLYRDVVIPVIPVLQSMEEEGILINKEYLEKYHNELVEKKNKIELEIYELAGKKFEVASNDELAKVLERMGLPDYGRVKKDLYKTGEEILQKWKKDGYEIADKLLQYRSVAKLDNTFVGKEKDKKDDNGFDFLSDSYKKEEDDSSVGITQYIMSDGRIHGTIMPALTKSGRGLSLNPNLQNFVKKKSFRKIFMAPKDFLICEADYSGFQLRLMGIYSKDETMIDAFVNQGGDLHSVTGCEIFSQGTDLDYFMKHKKQEPYYTARFNGKCFIEGTKIKTNKGSLNIESFIPKINIGNFTNFKSDIKVFDRFNNLKDISLSFCDIADETLEFILENGDVIEVTPNHFFPVLRNGKEIKIQARDILESDEFIGV